MGIDAPRVVDLRKYISLSQAVKITGRSLTAIRGWCDVGRVRSVRDPVGRRLILRADLDRILPGAETNALRAKRARKGQDRAGQSRSSTVPATVT